MRSVWGAAAYLRPAQVCCPRFAHVPQEKLGGGFGPPPGARAGCGVLYCACAKSCLGVLK